MTDLDAIRQRVEDYRAARDKVRALLSVATVSDIAALQDAGRTMELKDGQLRDFMTPSRCLTLLAALEESEEERERLRVEGRELAGIVGQLQLANITLEQQRDAIALLADEQQAEIARLTAEVAGLKEAEQHLINVDAALSNRSAFDDKPSRVAKILHAINTAKEVDPLKAKLKQAEADLARAREQWSVLEKADAVFRHKDKWQIRVKTCSDPFDHVITNKCCQYVEGATLQEALAKPTPTDAGEEEWT